MNMNIDEITLYDKIKLLNISGNFHHSMNLAAKCVKLCSPDYFQMSQFFQLTKIFAQIQWILVLFRMENIGKCWFQYFYRPSKFFMVQNISSRLISNAKFEGKLKIFRKFFFQNLHSKWTYYYYISIFFGIFHIENEPKIHWMWAELQIIKKELWRLKINWRKRIRLFGS